MESWENKVISDKIDSLQQLPAGYTPNLASKWEIIEAGLPKKKKSSIPLLMRWTVAAAIITCVTVTSIKVNQYKKAQNEGISFTSVPSLQLPLPIQKEQTIVVAKPPVTPKTELQKALKPTPVSETVSIAKQDQPPFINNELKMDPVIPLVDSAIVATDELAITIPQPGTSKRAKHRTFQKDFNDGLLVMDTGYSKPANPQFSFKIQLHKAIGDEAQPSRRLQLKQGL